MRGADSDIELLDMLCRRCTKLFDPGSRTTRSLWNASDTGREHSVTYYSAGVDIHSASAQSRVQLISAHFRHCGAKQLIICDSRVDTITNKKMSGPNGRHDMRPFLQFQHAFIRRISWYSHLTAKAYRFGVTLCDVTQVQGWFNIIGVIMHSVAISFVSVLFLSVLFTRFYHKYINIFIQSEVHVGAIHVLL